MMNAIDYDYVLKLIDKQAEEMKGTHQHNFLLAIKQYIITLPTVDAEPIIRCNTCKYGHNMFRMSDNREWCECHKNENPVEVDADGHCEDARLKWDEQREDGCVKTLRQR